MQNGSRNWIASVPTDTFVRMSSVDKLADSCKPSIVPKWTDVVDGARRLADAEAVRLGAPVPDEYGWLLWLDARMGSETRSDGGTGEPPTTLWWRSALLDFWRSEAPFFAAAVGIRGTKSTTIIKTSFTELILRPRLAVLDQVAVWGVMSANTAEANQRCDTIGRLMRGVGLGEVAKAEDVAEGRYAASVSVATGRSHFTTLDAAGNKVRIMISPPTKGAASGWTGAGFFADELALWQDEKGNNPASEVLTLAHGRLYGQRGAHGYHVSVPMGPRDPLSTMIANAEASGVDGLHVARLGELGARRDHEARAALRAHFQRLAVKAPTATARTTASRYADDKRLAEDADPMATRIPTWAARDGEPGEEIKECWRLSSLKLTSGEEGGDPIDVLFARYGARPAGDVGKRLFSPAIIEQARAVAPVW